MYTDASYKYVIVKHCGWLTYIVLCAACYCLFKIDDRGKGTFTHRDLSDMIHALLHMQSRGLIPRRQNYS